MNITAQSWLQVLAFGFVAGFGVAAGMAFFNGVLSLFNRGAPKAP